MIGPDVLTPEPALSSEPAAAPGATGSANAPMPAAAGTSSRPGRSRDATTETTTW